MKLEKYRIYIAAGITAFLVLACAIVTFFLFNNAKTFVGAVGSFLSILSPFFIGAVIAYLLAPIYNLLARYLGLFFAKLIKKEEQSQRLASALALLLSLLFAFFVVYALIAMVIPGFIDSLTSRTGLIAMLPTYIKKLVSIVESFLAGYPDIVAQIDEFYHNGIRDIMAWAEENLSSLSSLSNSLGDIAEVFSDVFEGLHFLLTAVLNILIGIVVTCYLLQSKSKLIAQSKKITYSVFGAELGNRIVLQCRYIHKVFGGFIRGKLIDSLIIGVLCYIVTSLVQIPYALVVSVIVGVTNIIPFFGPIIGAVPTVLLVVLISPIKALWLAVIILAIQQVDGNIIGPLILGDATGLSSFWVLFSIVLFGGIWGFVGMVVGVPLFAVIYTAVDYLVNQELNKKGLSVATADYYFLDHIKLPEKEHLYMADPTKALPRKEAKQKTAKPETDGGFTESDVETASTDITDSGDGAASNDPPKDPQD